MEIISPNGVQSDRRRCSNGDISMAQSSSTANLVITEETHEEVHEDNDQDDETASKGSKESKDSDNENVINTKYDNEKDSMVQPTKNQLLRRKSMAPRVLNE